MITQGYRSVQEQDALYAQGRNKPGAIVTNARGGESAHNFGIAVDLYGGNWDDAYYDSVLGPAVASVQGLRWGGTFSKPDRPHVEWARGGPWTAERLAPLRDAGGLSQAWSLLS